MRPGQTPFKESVWSLKSPAADEATLETQTDALLAVLVPLTSEFQQLISDCTIELDCRIEIDDGDGVPPLSIGKDAVQFLANIRAGIEVTYLDHHG